MFDAPRRTRPPRNALIAVLVTLALGGSFAVLQERMNAGRPVLTPLAAQVASLRADNGLYFRPALLDNGQPTLADSAYGFAVMRMADHPRRAPWNSAQSQALVRTDVQAGSIWTRWYLYTIEEATGSTAPGAGYPQVLTGYRNGGYLEDASVPATDNAARLAATAAALEVARARGVAVSPAVRTGIRNWLATVVGSLANPYQACNASAIASALGATVSPQVAAASTTWWKRRGDSLTELNSAEDVLDVYGYACASPDARSGPQAQQLRTLLAPYLARTTDSYIGYHLARAWTLLGGSPGDLVPLADTLAARSTGSGLLSAEVSRTGTLDSAYSVSEIREETGQGQRDDSLAQAAGTSVREHAGELNSVSLAEAALIRRRTGKPEPELERTAAAALAREAPGLITTDTVAAWARWHDLGVRMGTVPSGLRVQTWPLTSHEARCRAWLLLASVTSDERAAVPPELRAELDRIPQALAQGAATMSMSELRAGTAALANFGAASRTPTEPVRRALNALRGCARLPDLYRDRPASPTCDLTATADGYWLNSVLPL